QLELYDLESDLTGPSIAATTGQAIPIPSLYRLLGPVQAQAKKGSPEAYYLFTTSGKLVAGPTQTKAPLEKQRDHLLALARRQGGTSSPAKSTPPTTKPSSGKASGKS